MTYKQPYMPESGYSFVAAGALWKTYAGMAVYTRYRQGTRAVTVTETNSRTTRISCPDRELVIVSDSVDSDGFYPYGESFDACLDISLFNDRVCKGLDIDYIMTNYAHSASSAHPRVTLRTPPEDRVQMMSDSGGLQLIRGVKGIIHPVELINFYNNNVDAGMVLDLPLHFSDMKLCKRLAQLQKKNNDIMLSKSKGVDLINIFHGQTVEERDLYRSIVEDPKIPRVAIARAGFMEPVTMVNSVCEVLQGGMKYKQHHVLGVYTSSHIPLLVKLANCKSNPVHITSDSTSHIQSSLNKAYHYQFDLLSHMKRLAIGDRRSISNCFRYLPCQCSICTTVKYMDVLSAAPTACSVLLSIHNAHEMSRYAKQLQDVCVSSTSAEYNALVSKQLEKSHRLRDVQSALDFIDVYNDYGLKAAQKKYGQYLNRMTFSKEKIPTSSLGLIQRAIEEDESEVKKKRSEALYRAMLKQIEGIHASNSSRH